MASSPTLHNRYRHAVDLAGYMALEAACDLWLALSVCVALDYVLSAAPVSAHSHYTNHVQSAVDVPVAYMRLRRLRTKSPEEVSPVFVIEVFIQTPSSPPCCRRLNLHSSWISFREAARLHYLQLTDTCCNVRDKFIVLIEVLGYLTQELERPTCYGRP